MTMQSIWRRKWWWSCVAFEKYDLTPFIMYYSYQTFILLKAFPGSVKMSFESRRDANRSGSSLNKFEGSAQDLRKYKYNTRLGSSF